MSDESGAGKALLKEFISNLPYIPIYLEVKDLLYYSDDNSKLVDYFSNFGFVNLSDYVDELDLHPINSKIPMLLVSPYNKCLKNIDKYSFIKNIQKNVDDMNLF